MKRMSCHIPSLLLGLCFLISGSLKGIDPYGTSLKLGEYFRVWGWDGFVADHALACSVWLCACELCLGRCSPVGWRALRGLALRLAGVGGGHVHHPLLVGDER